MLAQEGGTLTDVGMLAVLIHDEYCSDPRPCSRWEAHPGHQDYYLDRARNIIARLEAEIGGANVELAVRVIMDELSG